MFFHVLIVLVSIVFAITLATLLFLLGELLGFLAGLPLGFGLGRLFLGSFLQLLFLLLEQVLAHGVVNIDSCVVHLGLA